MFAVGGVTGYICIGAVGDACIIMYVYMQWGGVIGDGILTLAAVT